MSATLSKLDEKIALTLTVEERLRLENAKLRVAYAEMQLEQARGFVKSWADEIYAKHGVSMDGWNINLETGMCMKPGGLGSVK
jgi:hypothetical protein